MPGRSSQSCRARLATADTPKATPRPKSDSGGKTEDGSKHKLPSAQTESHKDGVPCAGAQRPANARNPPGKQRACERERPNPEKARPACARPAHACMALIGSVRGGGQSGIELSRLATGASSKGRAPAAEPETWILGQIHGAPVAKRTFERSQLRTPGPPLDRAPVDPPPEPTRPTSTREALRGGEDAGEGIDKPTTSRPHGASQLHGAGKLNRIRAWMWVAIVPAALRSGCIGDSWVC